MTAIGASAHNSDLNIKSNKNTMSKKEALIPNAQLEEMFLRVCTDDQMRQYTQLVDSGYISLATAYASRLVHRLFFEMIEEREAKQKTTYNKDDQMTDSFDIPNLLRGGEKR